MYQFIDTIDPIIEDTAGNEGLPAEAVSINGDFIENLIPGYRTLYVSGRESLAKEIVEYDATKADGSQINYTRFPARTIKVGFQVLASSDAEYRSIFNRLNTILNVEDAEICFNDESDKYFTGNPIMSAEIQPGQYNVTGEYEIYCTDPFKYEYDEQIATTQSITPGTGAEDYDPEKTYQPGDMAIYNGNLYECGVEISTPEAWTPAHWIIVTYNAFVINNDGGYSCYPRFEVDFAPDVDDNGVVGRKGNCGFIQFDANNESRIQFGDATEGLNVSTTRFWSTFTASTGAFTNAANNTTVPGTTYIDKGNAAKSADGLKPGYGTHKVNVWHGSYLTANAAAAGNFTMQWQQNFHFTNKKQVGLFGMFIMDANNNVICSIRLDKGGTSNTKGTVRYYVQNTQKATKTVDFAKTGVFGYVAKTVKKKKKKTTTYTLRKATNTITREGDTLKVQLACDSKPVYFYNVPTTAVAKVGVFFGQYNAKPLPAMNTLISAKFVDGDSGDNTFRSGDNLIVDCNTTESYFNRILDMSIGDVGNEWSEFKLKPGQNVVYVGWSDFVQAGYTPTVKMYYKRRWL